MYCEGPLCDEEELGEVEVKEKVVKGKDGEEAVMILKRKILKVEVKYTSIDGH